MSAACRLMSMAACSHHATCGRDDHHRRSHVALRGRDQNCEPDLAGPRDPDPTRAVVHVVRRARKSVCPRRSFPGSIRSARSSTWGDGLRLFVVCPDAANHQARVRAFRVRADPDLTNKDIRLLLRRVISKSGRGRLKPSRARRGLPSSRAISATWCADEPLTDEPRLDLLKLEHEIAARDRESTRDDPGRADHAIRSARATWATGLSGYARRRIDSWISAGPLIAVRLRILTRKTLGGLEKTCPGACCDPDGTPLRASTRR